MEIWKPIKDYEDLYEVSTLGRVRSKSRVRRIGNGKGYDKVYESKILTPSINNCGYKIVVLLKPGTKPICKSVHRLVAETFIANFANLSDVNHKDENKLNNCVENLEWISHRDNMRYGTISERRGSTVLNKSYSTRLAEKFARGWMPNLFRRKKRYAVIYKGERYESREEWAECVGLSRARLSQLVAAGKAQIETYYTVELVRCR